MKKLKNDINIIKPVIKWVGGKTQIINTLLDKFPKQINNYHEIFVGGSSVLMGLLCMIKQKEIMLKGNIYAYDINETLIYLFKNIQTHHYELNDCIQNIITEYKQCHVQHKHEDFNPKKPQNKQEAMLCKEAYYYWTRKCYNALTSEERKTIQGSSLFLFLNKTCFRGLYRVNSSNSFNVSFSHYRNPEIINKKHLDDIHDLIQPVEFRVCDFRSSLQNSFCKDDFVYIDPPYAPIPNQVQSFVNYNKDGFNIKDHNILFSLCHNLLKRDIHLMMSNANVPEIHNAFDTKFYNIEKILCKRQINSKKPDSKTHEVIITNFNMLKIGA